MCVSRTCVRVRSTRVYVRIYVCVCVNVCLFVCLRGLRSLPPLDRRRRGVGRARRGEQALYGQCEFVTTAPRDPIEGSWDIRMP
jgi:hypothetical protein